MMYDLNEKPECHAVQYPKKESRVYLLIEGVDDPNITEIFAEAFINALRKAELHDGTIQKRTHIRITNGKITTRLIDTVNKQGFSIQIHGKE